MKITDIKLHQLQGDFEYNGNLWEERPGRPLDIYPQFRNQGVNDTIGKLFPYKEDGCYRVTQTFVFVETDAGVTGVVGPLTGDGTAYYIALQLKPLLIGENPLATEYLWELMYRNAPNGRFGDNMIAISHIDYALWDIKGKLANQPIHALLGGPVQDKIPAYASTAGFSLEPKKAAARVRQLKHEGYMGSKWFFRCGAGDGAFGEKSNIELMGALRDAAGTDMDIMIDAWANWGVPYTLKMSERLKEFKPAWIEEPVQYPLHDSYLKLKLESPIPIAGGEHEFTRWGAKSLLEKKVLDIYQFEPIWAGGMSEMIKISALLTSYDAVFIPHVYVPAASTQVAFTLNSLTTPMLEYHYILGQIYQFFLTKPISPVNGKFYPPEEPGLGITIDQNKVDASREVTFD